MHEDIVEPVSTSAPLVASGLRKTLGLTLAIRRVDLTVRSNEVVALFGANGAGKTTLLHLLAGLIRPDEGTIRVGGLLDPTRAKVRARIGFAPQSTAVYDDLSVVENLAFFASISGVSRERLDDAVARGLAFARLENRANARAGTLSGGMRRRLHVASAVLHDPVLILLDEPTVGIDGESSEHLIQAIGALRDRGIAIVWSTHDSAPVDLLGARPFRLSAGQVLS